MCDHELGYVDVDDTVRFCNLCGAVIAYRCELCHGEGYGQENDLEGDWVNCTDKYVVCPACRGEGWFYDNGSKK